MVAPVARAPTRQACDACRLRKIKCVPLDPVESKTNAPCKPCSGGKLDCTYVMPVKRRGPPPKRRRIPVESPDHDDITTSEQGTPHGSSVIATPQESHATSHSSSLGADPSAIHHIFSKPVFNAIIQDYLDIIYPLVPVVHRPTFLNHLQNERYLHDSTFQSFCLAICGLVIGILPRRFHEYKIDGTLPVHDRRELVNLIHNIILKNRPVDYFDKLSHEKWAIAYMLSTTCAHLGHRTRARMQHGETNTLCIELELHRIASYAGLDYIEAQLRKKAFWLNFTTYSHIRAHEVQWDSLGDRFIFDMADAELLMPLEIDDEYITATEIFEQPSNRTSLVSGFNALTHINNCLVTIVRDRSLPLLSCNEPSGDLKSNLATCACGRHVQQASISSLVQARLQKTKSVLDDLPAELRPWPSLPDHVLSQNSPPVSLLFSQYESMKANIHVTHLWVQSLLLERFVASNYAPAASHDGNEHPDKVRIWEMREDICRQLLHLLNNISQANLEPNGYFLILKTRQVAASLLDCPWSGGDHVSLKAKAYIQSFADILARLDNAYQNDFRSGLWEELDEQTRESPSTLWSLPS